MVKEGGYDSAPMRGHGVWIPAFAGTTLWIELGEIQAE
jgi:hypothetical protein